ncbi:MAG: TonB-dependent receptor [Paludibacteraceae bacterium]|nr:TonB-dependent receptor [Paludibacteraceae bacterium]MBQ9297148.1 TonB-dependent receptor [Paludibacteraceae bacterium]MBR1556492.1 TonB-dependent receptor [Prevotella sp.]
MRKKVLLCLFGVSLYCTATPVATEQSWSDSVSLPDIEVSVSRQSSTISRQPSNVSVIDNRLIEETRVVSPKDVSALIPNVYMPDYGSAMTSSIYIRGLGSRINEPVLGMVVDGVPLLDKNMYDHSMQDVKRIELLCGPQGSLYGRNSPGGVMEIRTIQPLDLTTQLIRGEVGYATANQIHAQASIYRPEKNSFGWGIAARYRRTDGFYTNDFNGKKIDNGQQAGGRIILDGQPNDEWRITGSLHADWIKQGAFPYAAAETGIISYNAPAGYERLVVLPSLRALYEKNGYKLSLVASYQMLRDNMLMDQDYTTDDIFTLNQRQQQHNATFDALLTNKLKIKNDELKIYEWQAGLSAFGKTNRMSAPVTFMRQGIEELILGNANRGIQTVFPDDSIEISNQTLPILSDFGLYNAGVAIYHQSHLQIHKWHIRAGIRLDYEYTQMDYLSTADLNYRFTMIMDQLAPVSTRIEGTKQAHYFQFLPRLAVSYEHDWVTAYAYAAKGYKAGGYNPQIFSTITQNQVMTDMAADMGMHLDMADKRFSDISITQYKPEKDWTFELGAHFTPVEGLKIDVDAFHIQCFDQQVTVFPNGKTTGRMMANAARSRIWGVETAIHYRWNHGNWHGIADASYGFIDARFIDFNDGMGNYANHFIPYAPQHTLHGLFAAQYRVGKKWLEAVSAGLQLNMLGSIYWNEQNDCKQDIYALLGANVSLYWKYVQLQLWAKNLTGSQYNVFYFRSMGNDFLQKGRPRELGATVRFEI